MLISKFSQKTNARLRFFGFFTSPAHTFMGLLALKKLKKNLLCYYCSPLNFQTFLRLWTENRREEEWKTWTTTIIEFSWPLACLVKAAMLKPTTTEPLFLKSHLHLKNFAGYLINIWQMFNVAIDNLAVKPYRPKSLIWAHIMAL